MLLLYGSGMPLTSSRIFSFFLVWTKALGISGGFHLGSSLHNFFKISQVGVDVMECASGEEVWEDLRFPAERHHKIGDCPVLNWMGKGGKGPGLPHLGSPSMYLFD